MEKCECSSGAQKWFLPICWKIFEKIIHKKTVEHFTENDLISRNQSGFKCRDSCVRQLLFIAIEIYNYFDGGLETRGVFLDLSKDFDKV